MCNRPFALTALMSVVALITTGLTVDLRFFDFPNIVVWMLAGSAIGRAAHVDAGALHRANIEQSSRQTSS
jgi:hypothetical protein